MQKFVIIKRTQKPSVDIIETQVRMSGYLKKKRNRVGGWRKLWFVLQNQLLLSYSSREDYEKKLVPFKDVLNLVPGSVVRPASNSRFTIETTSNTIYTFRCIDSKTCADWIMALLESLALNNTQPSVIDKNKSSSYVMTKSKNKNNKKMLSSSRSCDSLSSSSAAAVAATARPMSRSTPKLVRLPISNSTKRLVERGCDVDDCNYVKLRGEITNEMGVVQNFRLHQNALKKNQSKEVSRINRMFYQSHREQQQQDDHKSNNHHQHRKPQNPKRHQCTTASRSTGGSTSSSVGCGGCNGSSSASEMMDDNRVNASDRKFSSGRNEESQLVRKKLPNSSHIDSMDLNQNKMIDEDDLEIYSNIEEQIQHLTLDDEIDGDYSLQELKQHQKNQTNKKSLLEYHFNCENKKSIKKDVNGENDNVNADDDDDDGVDSIENENRKKIEAIYAVVDLKNKHERRAQRKELELHEKERPKSYHVSSNDYEDVNNISPDIFQHSNGSENIYEPVNLGENNSHKNAVWRYFPKINFDSIMEFARLGKDHHHHPPNKIEKDLDDLNENGNGSGSSFADMKRKLGNHRRSIKDKMKKFYTRTDRPPKVKNDNDDDDESTAQNNVDKNSRSMKSTTPDIVLLSKNALLAANENDTNKEAKSVQTPQQNYRPFRRDRNIFGSLPKMRKSRTTACLDDVTDGPKKRNPLSKRGNSEFHIELKREVCRRTTDL